MNPEIKEFGWIRLPGEITSDTHRVRMIIDGREFVRLYGYGSPVIWREENEPGFIEGKELQDLESIFKAWCLDNNKTIDPPNKLLNQ